MQRFVTAENKKLGYFSVPELPFHARLQGHLGEPAFAACPHAERIFFVEQVITVYPETIRESDRKYHWPLGRRPDDHASLSELGL